MDRYYKKKSIMDVRYKRQENDSRTVVENYRRAFGEI